MSQDPQRHIVREAAFKVVGLSARTSNAAEAGPGGAIPKLWARLKAENTLHDIPHKSSDDLIAVYTDYERGKEGAYTFVLGTKVRSADTIPGGMVAQEIVAGNYEVFETHDASVQALVDLWSRIWALEDEGQLKRAYRTDYEVHHQPKADAQVVPIEIYIGVRN